MACRLAIVSSHPIQYNAPAFTALASDRRLRVKVFYGWEGTGNSVDPEFGHPVKWDVPLLEGYEHVFIANESRDPGTHRFGGLKNPGMVREINNWTPDVILLYGWSFDSHLKVMRAFKGKVPILFRGDSTLLGKRSEIKRVARRVFLRWVFNRIDVALYVGKRNKEYYLEMGLDESRLVWAPHAIDNDRFADRDGNSEAGANAWRSRLGIRRTDVVFLFAGKLIKRKDPFTLIKAFLRLNFAEASSRPHLVFAGEGELRTELEAASRGRSDIHFLGFQNQSAMPVVYRLGDVMVLPSLIDTWGLAVNESMASSRPVIVSDLVGCAPDLVQRGLTGEVFRNGDVKGLTNILSTMKTGQTRTGEMGLAARSLINDWSIDAYASAVSEVARTIGCSTSSPSAT